MTMHLVRWCSSVDVVYLLLRTFAGQIWGNPFVYIFANQAFNPMFIEWSVLGVRGEGWSLWCWCTNNLPGVCVEHLHSFGSVPPMLAGWHKVRGGCWAGECFTGDRAAVPAPSVSVQAVQCQWLLRVCLFTHTACAWNAQRAELLPRCEQLDQAGMVISPTCRTPFCSLSVAVSSWACFHPLIEQVGWLQGLALNWDLVRNFEGKQFLLQRTKLGHGWVTATLF